MQDPSPADILILGGTVLPMNDAMEIIEDGGLAIKGDSILAVGASDSIRASFSAPKTIGASGRLVMPGLINTHTHTPMTILRGFKDDLALQAWLDSIWPWEHEHINPATVRVNSCLAMAEMIHAGITTFNDMYFYGTETARLASEVGMRALISEPYAEGGPYDFNYMVRATENMMDEFADDELIVPTVAPHSMYACTKDQLIECAELAAHYDCPVHTHLAETEGETEMVLSAQGVRPVAYADSLGLLHSRTILAHCVQVDDEEIELLRERGVGVSHNPQSNMKLASGAAPVPAMLRVGLDVGLGTDGAASNNVLDILEEVKAAALLHKVISGDATAVEAPVAARMATIVGARVLGLSDRVGSLEPGKLADIITLDVDRPHMAPCYNPFSHVVYVARGSDVCTVIINGRVVMEERELTTIDEAEAVRSVRDLAASID